MGGEMFFSFRKCDMLPAYIVIKYETIAIQLNLLPNDRHSYPITSKMFNICAIPDVNGRPKHDNPFGKAKKKNAHFNIIRKSNVSLLNYIITSLIKNNRSDKCKKRIYYNSLLFSNRHV
jgi:hypothetical protein